MQGTEHRMGHGHCHLHALQAGPEPLQQQTHLLLQPLPGLALLVQLLCKGLVLLAQAVCDLRRVQGEEYGRKKFGIGSAVSPT